MATPFKMKSSPTKGKLGDFFRNITKKATPETKAKRVEAKSTRKAGESQYKADVRRGKERRAKEKVAKAVEPRTDVLSKNIRDTSDLTVENRASLGEKVYPQQKPKSKAYVPQEFKGKKGDKFKYKRKSDSLTGDYEFQRPGSDIWETSKTKAGNEAIESLYWSDDGAHTKDPYYNSPVEKKSPYKKGLGKYAKQAKGSRGYKMKRK